MRLSLCAKLIFLTFIFYEANCPASPTALNTDPKDGLSFFRYNENYFITGKEQTKIQLSFKIQMISDWGFFLGYTQLMFWDIGVGNSHFSDVNYNPEIFYNWHIDNWSFKEINLSPIEHKSDGEYLANARSWNRAYISLVNEFSFLHLNVLTESKFFYIYELDDTNSEVQRKLGYFEFGMNFENLLPGIFYRNELSIKIVPGGVFSLQQNEGHQEVAFKMKLQIPRLNPSIYMQVFNGTDESLLYYTRTATSYRIGLAF